MKTKGKAISHRGKAISHRASNRESDTDQLKTSLVFELETAVTTFPRPHDAAS